MPLVTILARDLRLKVFNQTLGDVARGARHDIGAKFAVEKVVNNTGRLADPWRYAAISIDTAIHIPPMRCF